MKKLIAAVVTAAVIVPVSAYSAATLYGKVHMTTAYQDDGLDKNLSVNSNSSRVGVKGSEDLGNGLKAVYKMEWEVDLRGGDTIKNRDRYAGVAGGFGTVLAGYLSTPLKAVGRKVDMFGDRMGDLRSLNNHTNIDGRVSNTLAYVTPKFAGFNATLAYVADVTGSRADNNDTDAYSANAMYANGPVYVGVGYTSISGNTFTSTEDEDTWRIAGSFKMGSAKILGSYTDTSNASGVSGEDPAIWHLGASYGFGSNTAKIQYSERDDVLSADNGAYNITVALDHKLSKRTMAYVEYSMTDNDAGSSTTAWKKTGNSTSGISGEDNSGIALGLVHKF